MEYSIVFSGEIADAASLAQVRENFAKLFRLADDAKLDRLFSGQPAVLKKGLNATEAEKYRQALLKAGAVCEIRGTAPVAATPPVPVARPAPAAMPSAPQAAALTLAPLEEKPATPDATPARPAGIALAPLEKKPDAPTAVARNVSQDTAPSRDRMVVVKGSGAGYGDSSIMPDEARGLCWGGFFMPWIWGTFNGVKISFLALPAFRLVRRFIPGWILISLSVLMSLFMLVRGRELAWQNRDWDSAEHFNRVQRYWTMAGVAMATVLTVAVPLWVSHSRHEQKMAEMAAAEQHRAEMAAQEKERQQYLDNIQDPAEREQAEKEFSTEDAQAAAATTE